MNNSERFKIKQALAVLHDLVDGDRATSDNPWYGIAIGEIGEKEKRGPSLNNPRIVEYLSSTRLGKKAASRDETPWCSAFVNWCMEQADIEGTNSARARSWLGWGVELEEPRKGCVVVFRRGKPWQGHVAFCTGIRLLGLAAMVECLGGNQNDSVCIKNYKESDVLSYRWPA